MTDMIERVARAMCRNRGLDPDEATSGEGRVFAGGGSEFIVHRRRWAEHSGDARAAIEAMREPTGEMLDAGDAACAGANERVWPAMIDAALAEPPPR